MAKELKDLPETFDIITDVIAIPMKDIRRLWNGLPAEKRVNAKKFLEYKNCISLKQLMAVAEVTAQQALNIQDALKAVKIDSNEWRLFDIENSPRKK